MPLSRRNFLVGCSATIAALAGGRVGGLAFAAEGLPAQRDILVVVSLRGGCDGLNLIAPVDDPAYVAARSAELRLAERGEYAGLRLKNALPGFDFRLHPAAAALKEIYDSGDLALVHACGLTDGTRSHFEAMEYMELGAARQARPTSGWLSRHLAAVGAPGMLPAVAVNNSLPLALLADPTAVSLPSPASFSLQGHWRYGPQQLDLLREAYGGAARLEQAGARTLTAIDTLASYLPHDSEGNPLPYQPADTVEYPAEEYAAELSSALQSVSQLVKMEVGLQVATVDYGGWDTHEGQSYIFPELVEGLSRSLAAFYNDLSAYRDRLTVVVISEFGRRLRANESGGTDHGFGNAMLVLGGQTNGGQMYGRWPGLATEQLADGADLAITTDYRTVLSEILTRRLANPQIEAVFPGFSSTYQPLSILR